MEAQLRRFGDEMERILVELDTIRGQIVSVGATTGAAKGRELAGEVRALREQMGAVSEGMAAAYEENAVRVGSWTSPSATQEHLKLMAVRVGINGFGRIGRNLFRAAKAAKADIDFVAVNDLTDAKTLAHLLKYDSILGPYPGTVEVDGDDLVIDGDKLRVLSERDPGDLPWDDLGAEVVIESTGLFTKKARRRQAPRRQRQEGRHLRAGHRAGHHGRPRRQLRVRLRQGLPTTSSPTRRCTTNCLAPFAKVINDTVGIKHGLMTTIHAYTADQRLQDMPHSDLRRARAAALNLIPASTGAAKAVGLVLPELNGKLSGFAIRAPVPTGSVVDLTFEAERETTRGGDQRGDEGGGRRPAEGHPRVHGGPDRLHRTSSATRTRRSSTRSSRSPSTARWSRPSPGTTTSGATPTAASTSCRSSSR